MKKLTVAIVSLMLIGTAPSLTHAIQVQVGSGAVLGTPTGTTAIPITGQRGNFLIESVPGTLGARVKVEGTTIKKLSITDAIITKNLGAAGTSETLTIAARHTYQANVAGTTTQHYGLTVAGNFVRGSTVATNDRIQATGFGGFQDCPPIITINAVAAIPPPGGCSIETAQFGSALTYTVSGAGLSKNTVTPNPLQTSGSLTCNQVTGDTDTSCPADAFIHIDVSILLRTGDKIKLLGSVDGYAADSGTNPNAANDVNTAMTRASLPIDILPGIGPDNFVKLGSLLSVLLPVAVLGSEEQPIANVASFALADFRLGRNGAAPFKKAVTDVNLDGFDDLLLVFKTHNIGLLCGDAELILTVGPALTPAFEGSDSVRLLGCPPE